MKAIIGLLIMILVFTVGCATTENYSQEVSEKSQIVIKEYNVIAIATDSNDGYHIREAERFASSFSQVESINCSTTLLLGNDATVKNLRDTILTTTKPSIDNVIYLTGHGGDGEISITDQLMFADLIAMCRETEAIEILIVASCFSGSIRKNIAENDDIIVISSTDGDFADSAGDQVGLTASLFQVFANPAIADYDNNSQVTIEEVWLRAKEVHEEFLESDEWKSQAEFWNNVPENKYGLFGDKNYILYNL